MFTAYKCLTCGKSEVTKNKWWTAMALPDWVEKRFTGLYHIKDERSMADVGEIKNAATVVWRRLCGPVKTTSNVHFEGV